MHENLVGYYHQRAAEYEKIYAKPERQDDLKTITAFLQAFFSGREVLEIACGTGFWTEKIAQTARSILALDINQSVLDIARSKGYGGAKVQFKRSDLFDFSDQHKYENLFGGFIWSHIPLQDLDIFLQKINSLVQPGGKIVFIDNNYVAGSNHPITQTDVYGNTFQTRKLENGSEHLVLKNFPSENFLREMLKEVAKPIEMINLKHYWIMVLERFS